MKRPEEIYGAAIARTERNQRRPEPEPGWQVDDHGMYQHLHGWSRARDKECRIEVRIEPLLFGASYLAVYVDGDLVGDKVPITLGTPTHINMG